MNVAADVVRLDAGHEDLIHDVAFDFYGQRMATCSSDQTVKVWDLTGKDERGRSVWEENDVFKAHDASVLRLAWAHPEFGQVLATCSVDRIIRIWEEQQQEQRKSGKRWTESARLVESRATIQDIKFAPKHMGLKLAACSADGFVRIYEAMDVMNLARWHLMDEFEACSNAREQSGGFCLSWCLSRFLHPHLVVGCGKEPPKIFRYNDASRKWIAVCTLNVPNGTTVNDVAWAPNVGRDYHLIAAACKDKSVRIFKVTFTNDKPQIEKTWTFMDEHDAEVWRVEWNVTGTVLSSSGDDGTVRLWRANFEGEWSCTATITGDSRAALSAGVA